MSLLFAGTALAAYFLIAPLMAQWLQLWVFQVGSPRRTGLAEATSVPLVNEISKKRFCAHEAGHGLMYGLGDSIPEDLYLYVEPDLVGDGVGGAVLGAQEFSHEQATLEALRFHLMMLAAGAAGERAQFGNMSISAYQDFTIFETLASYYMLCAGIPLSRRPRPRSSMQSTRRRLPNYVMRCSNSPRM